MQQQEYRNTEKQEIKQILRVLHQVPEVEIPVIFHAKFQEQLEKEAIVLAKAKKQKAHRKTTYRLIASIAACFAIGILTYGFYQDGMNPVITNTEAERSAISIEETDMAAPMMAVAEAPKSILSDEFMQYVDLLNGYFGDQNYSLVSYVFDEEKGQHIFQVVRANPKDGASDDSPLVMIGENGEVYEQR